MSTEDNNAEVENMPIFPLHRRSLLYHLLGFSVVVVGTAVTIAVVVATALHQSSNNADNHHHDDNNTTTILSPTWQSLYSDRASGDGGDPIILSRWTLHGVDYDDGDNNNATATHSSCSRIPATVPGDVLTDLFNAGIIDDPYYDRNFLTQRRRWMGPLGGDDDDIIHLWNNNDTATSNTLERRTRTWIYTTQFVLPEQQNINSTTTLTPTILLVLEGVKMSATVALNGVAIGPILTDQFLRYVIPLPPSALMGKAGGRHLDAALDDNDARPRRQQVHELTVTFDPKDDVLTDGRFMACSGGWDWAPYSRAGDGRGSGVLSFGIVRPVYLVAVDQYFVSAVVPKIYYQGDYPVEPLVNGPQGDFRVEVHVHLGAVWGDDDESRAKLTGRVSPQSFLLARSSFSNETYHIPLPRITANEKTTEVVINMTATKENVDLWWPNGLGRRHLYTLDVSLELPSATGGYRQLPWIRKKIGFRVASLVTVNDTDAATRREAHNEDGSGTHGFYFRINGAIMWSRGANVIPMDQLEGRYRDEAHVLLVRSAAAANMNMLRVWGGGTILPGAFYDACDEHGILVYHDMMFAQKNHTPVRSATVKDEIIHVVRTLASHVSIVVWNGCNECVYGGGNMAIYESFVMRTVADEDDTRAVWPSSPSYFGWAAGVSRLDGHPIHGKPLKVQNNTGRSLETHGPYERGFSDSHPGVNGFKAANAFDTNLPPSFRAGAVGPTKRNIFVSEFGASLFASFESMASTLPPSAWSVHGGDSPDKCIQVNGNENSCIGVNTMAERNYPCDNRIASFFGNDTSLDTVGPRAFQIQLYRCMIAQALWMKGTIESMRSSNSFGTLIWQLNENWPTGGWGLMEYVGTMASVASRSSSSNVKSGGDTDIQQQTATSLLSGGRWKPIMYLLRQSLFRDVFAACGKGIRCYVRNDGPTTVNASVVAEAWNLHDDNPRQTQTWNCLLPGGRRSTARFGLPTNFTDKHADVVLLRVNDAGHSGGIALSQESAFLWRVPWSLTRLWDNSAIMVDVHIIARSKSRLLFSLRSNRLVLYAVLSTRAEGRFLDNAFHLKPNQDRIVAFELIGGQSGEQVGVDVDRLLDTLHMEYLGSTYNDGYKDKRVRPTLVVHKEQAQTGLTNEQ